MIAATPRLRADLLVSEQGDGGAAVRVVKDPRSGRFFRFGPIEAFILEQLDGVRSLDTVRARTEERFGAPLPTTTLDQFARGLHGLGLLETGSAPSTSVGDRRVRGNLFHLRVRMFDPDRLLGKMLRSIRFFFTPYFVLLSALVILAAAGVTAVNWLEIRLDFPRLYSASSLALAYLTVLVVIAAHEFAHGLTCKVFGGSVREMGFLLLLFQPAFYCNVSDAWLFPEKSRRLWVTFAGAYFEIFIWALATLVWRATEPWTPVNQLALVVMATSGVKTLFNLNPLIKLDGYYLLSDWLEIPNLRQRAFGYLGERLRRLWGVDVQRQFGDASPRERRIYWIYGLLAWIYSLWLLSFVFMQFGGWLVGRYQGWGFVLFSIVLTGVFQYPLRKLLRTPTAGLSIEGGMKRLLKWSLRLGVLLAAGAILWFVRADLRLSGPFTVLPIHNADVRAEVEGILSEIHVDEGDAVERGDLIASLSDRDIRAELRKMEAEIVEKLARLNLLKAGTRPEELELARTGIGKGEERLKYARAHLEMERSLFDQLLASRQDFEEARELVAVREKELQEANDQLKLLLAGNRKEEIEATEAELSSLRLQGQYLDEELNLLKITSPAAGVVTTPKLRDKIGQSVKKGDLIAKVHDMDTVTVEIAVSETDIGDVVVGQKVVLRARALPQTALEGKVTAIAPIATQPEDPRQPRTVRVTTQLDNRSGLLKPDMTGHAKIYAHEQRLIQLVSRRLVRFIKVEFWSWW